MSEHIVKVWDRTYTVRAYQESKSRWIAIGDYMGELKEAKGKTESAAVRAWAAAAKYVGNDGPAPPVRGS
jgi:hypothetical protein